MKLFIGIDPGKKGGIGVITETGKLVDYCMMPETRHGVLCFLRKFHSTHTESQHIAIIESVHSMPKQGVRSVFTFGKGCGELLGICTALEFTIIEPTPQAWKKAMLAGTDRSKEASIKICENTFPKVQLIPDGCRKPSDGIAEAILLAEYGRRLIGLI